VCSELGAAGSPVHVQFQNQVQVHAWSSEKRTETPFDPVHVQFQIQRPGTAPDAPADAPVGVVVHAHVQSVLSVWAADVSAGSTLSVHVQFHVQASVPVGTTTVPPGSTTRTLTLFSPVVVAFAVTALAVAEFVCVAPASASSLPILTEMLTFVGFT
jgi:hypothetical protein